MGTGVMKINNEPMTDADMEMLLAYVS